MEQETRTDTGGPAANQTLAEQVHETVQALGRANCILDDLLEAGTAEESGTERNPGVPSLSNTVSVALARARSLVQRLSELKERVGTI